jgi:3-phosphoglycerate kinase
MMQKILSHLLRKMRFSIPLPIDVVCEDSKNISNKDINEVSDDEMIKDIGIKTSRIYKKLISEAGYNNMEWSSWCI